MIATEQALLFEEELSNVLDDYGSSYSQRIFDAYDIFKNITNLASSEEKVYFSGLYAKLLFIYNKHNLSQELIGKINRYRKFVRKLSQTPSLYCSKDDVETSIRVALTLLKIIAGDIRDPNLAKFQTEEPILSYPDEESESKVESFKLVVTQKSKSNDENPKIFGKNEDGKNVAIYLGWKWKSLWGYILPYSNVSVYDAEYHHTKNEYDVYYCRANTFLVYESDFLIDVTEVAHCFQHSGETEYFALLKWLSNSNSSTAMMIGNIVNNLFDALISNDEIEIDEFINKELSKSPLQYFYLKKYEPQKLGNISNEVNMIFESLLETINVLPEGETFTEPSFIAPQYGLQGRLDALIVDNEDENKKEVIELKSGKFPTKAIFIKDANGVAYSLTTWRNHYIQASCYNLILKSVYSGRYGNSSIYYAKDRTRPLRNAPILEGNFQDIVNLRNRIVGLYFDMANSNFHSFALLESELLKYPPSYWEIDLLNFKNNINKTDEFASEYLKEMLSFTFRELISHKVGKYSESPDNAYSNLWLNENKTNNRKVIANMKLNQEESDFETYYLLFDRTDSVEANFREGDQIVLYPSKSDGVPLILQEQLLKGVIKSISSKDVVISLRNKLLGSQFLNQYDFWILESDFLEHSYKRLPSAIFDFVVDVNFEVKVGRREQSISNIDFGANYLNEKQTEIVKAALEANNYFLIQGPPGTGKTSYVLRSIVEYYYDLRIITKEDENKRFNILLAAHTNRAVDQICTVLKEKTDIEFIRLGSKESSEHSNVLLSELSITYSLDELNDKFDKTRVVVATVSSLLSHKELFDLKYFDIAIIDEAAQILEPFVLSVINKCGKCIMIGDEKQLPAIVTQSQSNYMIENKTLNTIEMNDLSASYFQRMLKNAKNNNWTHSYGMLTHQGRMVEDIMRISNELFYQNKLLKLQNLNQKVVEVSSFYNVAPEEKIFINYAEAEYVISKIGELIKTDNSLEIGVISPFRTQCALIRSMLPDELKETVAIDTVERFQGSERDVIFISFAVNKAHHLFNISSTINIDGIEIDRKLNVAITRAKHQLYVTGSKSILEQSSIYKKFINLLTEVN